MNSKKYLETALCFGAVAIMQGIMAVSLDGGGFSFAFMSAMFGSWAFIHLLKFYAQKKRDE